jgi:hypothetical protein
VVAIATAPLAACDRIGPTAPGTKPAVGAARPNTEAIALEGEALRSCPEVRIPELPCLSTDLPDTVHVLPRQ